jgi:trimeric autotransporter adhesin
MEALMMLRTALVPALLAAAGTAHAQCAWVPGFAPNPVDPALDRISALAVADLGQGAALYISGRFDALGGSAVVRWDGARWRQIGENFQPSEPTRLLAFDDGGGMRLWAWGGFQQVGAATVSRFARWDGASWESLHETLEPGQSITALATADPGASAGPGGSMNRSIYASMWSPAALKRWMGQGWEPVSWDHDQPPWALEPFPHGGTEYLMAGGRFDIPALGLRQLLRFDGETWEPIGETTSGTTGGYINRLRTARVPQGGGGAQPSLFAAGFFTHVNGIHSRNIARFDGAAWHAMGSSSLPGLGIAPSDMLEVNFAQTPGLYIVGPWSFPGRVFRWNGGLFDTVGPNFDRRGVALAMFNDQSGNGDLVFAAGEYTSVSQQPVALIARWNDEAWAPLTSHLDGAVRAIVEDPLRPDRIIAAGEFVRAGGRSARRLASWDGFRWEPHGDVMNNTVNALAIPQPLPPSTSGSLLYAAGAFTSPGNRIAQYYLHHQWQQANWTNVGEGMNDVIYTIALFDEDGTGEKLFAGGWFTLAGGTPAQHIARWDGQAWMPVGGGVNLAVRALTVYDPDGEGPAPAALIAGGHFTSAGGTPARGIARWDGETWSPLGAGIAGPLGVQRVYALDVSEFGAAPVLYVGGEFTSAGSAAASNIARWDGDGWSALGAGTNGRVWSLGSHRQGTQWELYAGGEFTSAGSTPVRNLAVWDGAAWRSAEGGADGAVYAIHSGEVGGRSRALYIGGTFTSVSDDNLPSHNFGSFYCAPFPPCYANCDASTMIPLLNIDDFTCFINEFAAAQALPHEQQVGHYTNCDGSTAAPVLNVDDFTCFINAYAAGCP